MGGITGRMTWLGALRTAAFGQAAVPAFGLVAALIAGEGGIDPFFPAFGVVFVGAGIWAGRARGGINFAFIMLVLWFLLGIVFGGYKAFTHPSSWIDFVSMTAMVMFTTLGAIAFLRGRSLGWTAAADPLLTRAVGLLIVAALAGALASASIDESDRRQSGDIGIAAGQLEFDPTAITASAGTVSVFIDNQDATHHDFTIDDVVRLELPALKQKRAAFAVAAGTYRYYCTLHVDMEGTLTVS